MEFLSKPSIEEKQEVIPVAMNVMWMDSLLDYLRGNKFHEDKSEA